MQKKNFIRPALVTLGILAIFGVLQLTIGTGVDGQGFNWTGSDFAIIGVLVFIVSLLIELILQKAGKYRVVGVVGMLVLFAWLWAELAVGVFTQWGS